MYKYNKRKGGHIVLALMLALLMALPVLPRATFALVKSGDVIVEINQLAKSSYQVDYGTPKAGIGLPVEISVKAKTPQPEGEPAETPVREDTAAVTWTGEYSSDVPGNYVLKAKFTDETLVYSGEMPTISVTVKSPSFEISCNDQVIKSNKTFDMLEGVTLAVTPNTATGYSVKIKNVTSTDETYVWRQGETTFTSGPEGTVYTITYCVVNGAGVEEGGYTKVRSITVSDTTVSQYIPMLNKDDARVTSFDVTVASDGTGPFDAKEGPGFDSNGSNKVVRSFDTITYDLSSQYSVYTPATFYEQGRICYEIVLPLSQNQAEIDTSSMGWMEEGWTVAVDPSTGFQTLRCSRLLKPAEGNISSIPGSNVVNATIKVKAMNNGATV